MEFVEVKYKQGDAWSERAYTYKTGLDLQLGQRVYAPTYKNPRQEAVVWAVNVPEPGFPCREITETVPEGEEADA